jgi:DNA-binding NarL/FixJ family response regulator
MKNEKIKVAVADISFLLCEGIKSLVEHVPAFKWAGSAHTMDTLEEILEKKSPHVLMIDQTATEFASSLAFVRDHFPLVQVIAINSSADKDIIGIALDDGATSYLLKECDRNEIIEAIETTAARGKFFCGKITDCLLAGETKPDKALQRDFVSCQGVRISTRELEIIRLISEGYSTKEIAEMLFLSTHTVTTHRKNILTKLNVNNTAGLVMYAVKNSLLAPNKYLFS